MKKKTISDRVSDLEKKLNSVALNLSRTMAHLLKDGVEKVPLLFDEVPQSKTKILKAAAKVAGMKVVDVPLPKEKRTLKDLIRQVDHLSDNLSDWITRFRMVEDGLGSHVSRINKELDGLANSIMIFNPDKMELRLVEARVKKSEDDIIRLQRGMLDYCNRARERKEKEAIASSRTVAEAIARREREDPQILEGVTKLLKSHPLFSSMDFSVMPVRDILYHVARMIEKQNNITILQGDELLFEIEETVWE